MLSEKIIHIIGPSRIINRPMELILSHFETEPQALGSDVLIIWKEKEQPDYKNLVVMPENPDQIIKEK